MAINILKTGYKNDDGQDAVQVEIANGDLRALNEITDKYGVHDLTDIIAFAIAIMKESDGRPVAVTTADGLLRQFIPAKPTKQNDDGNGEKD